MVLRGAVLLPVVPLGGCLSFALKAKASSWQADISAAADLNPSSTGRPSPLTLRVYELNSDAAFNRADFLSLYQGDQAALGADLVAREEIVLQPSEVRVLKRALNERTRFVGVFAIYRSFERTVWRLAVPVRQGKAERVRLSAGSSAISFQMLG
jgi:type VI secretion system protein VasD